MAMKMLKRMRSRSRRYSTMTKWWRMTTKWRSATWTYHDRCLRSVESTLHYFILYRKIYHLLFFLRSWFSSCETASRPYQEWSSKSRHPFKLRRCRLRWRDATFARVLPQEQVTFAPNKNLFVNYPLFWCYSLFIFRQNCGLHVAGSGASAVQTEAVCSDESSRVIAHARVGCADIHRVQTTRSIHQHRDLPVCRYVLRLLNFQLTCFYNIVKCSKCPIPQFPIYV